MSERSLFNILCKLLGMWMTFEGISSLVWAFLASRYSDQIHFDPPEMASWFSGAVTIAFGLFLCTRSSRLTQFLFELDGSLDSQEKFDSES